jgi:hypothetical protein
LGDCPIGHIGASTALVIPKLLAKSRRGFPGQPSHLFHLFYLVHIRLGSPLRDEETAGGGIRLFGAHKNERTRRRPRPPKLITKTQNENILCSAIGS